MITFDGVTFAYPNAAKPALNALSLSLAAGDLTLLVGPSGSGKSTLLRLINGLVPHFSGGDLRGQIRVNGLDPVVVGPPQMSQHVGFVFQDPEAQFVVDRVEDEVAFALEHAGIAAPEMRLRVEETLDLLDLAALRNRPLEHLSGGEQQRVAIASALALRPAILVLDEPTSQLDPQSAEDVLNALVRLNSDMGLTIVLAEHRLERVLPFADRLVYLSGPEDKIVAGNPRDVLGQVALGSPLVQLGKALDWAPLPLTVKEAVRFRHTILTEPNAGGPALSKQAGLAEVAAVAEMAEMAEAAKRPGQPILQTKDLEFRYAQEPVLNKMNFSVAAGDMVALMGRNGSGKSTLLRCLMGLLQPQRGQITLHGQTIVGADVVDIAASIGYLPQDPDALLFAETVREELEITLQNHGRPPDPVQIDDLLRFLGIADLAERYPRDISVGQRQRVALAAVAITQPQILLLDEPTRGLDHAAKAALTRLLCTWQEKGMAIVVVTHDVEFAAALADRAVLLSQGEVLIEGSVQEVLGSSPFFTTQIARLFPGTGWLTLADLLPTAELS